MSIWCVIDLTNCILVIHRKFQKLFLCDTTPSLNSLVPSSQFKRFFLHDVLVSPKIWLLAILSIPTWSFSYHKSKYLYHVDHKKIGIASYFITDLMGGHNQEEKISMSNTLLGQSSCQVECILGQSYFQVEIIFGQSSCQGTLLVGNSTR